MRLFTFTTALTAAALLSASPMGHALAQAAKTAATAPSAPPAGPVGPAKDLPIVSVNGDMIKMSDVQAWADTHVPPEQRAQVDQKRLFQIAVNSLVTGKAVAIQARKEGLDRKPQVARAMQTAADEVLDRDYMISTVLPKVTEDDIKAKYDSDYANKAPETEIHARHILVDTEAKAQDIIKQLQAGAKFEDLAKKYGDPKDGATQNGGDLSWFKKGDMVPEFSDAAFKLKKGEYTTTPVKTHYGYHVIQVLDTRLSTIPAYDSVHDEIKQDLIRQAAKDVNDKALKAVKIVQYGPDGKPIAAADAPAAAPAKGKKK